jgi:DNA-binding transcriptional regulator YiaG
MKQLDIALYLCVSRSIVCCWLGGRRVLRGANAVLLRLLDRANTREMLDAPISPDEQIYPEIEKSA